MSFDQPVHYLCEMSKRLIAPIGAICALIFNIVCRLLCVYSLTRMFYIVNGLLMLIIYGNHIIDA